MSSRRKIISRRNILLFVFCEARDKRMYRLRMSGAARQKYLIMSPLAGVKFGCS